MANQMSSDNRRPADLVHFGLCFFGIIVAAGGVITLHIWTAITGALMLAWGLIYFSGR